MKIVWNKVTWYSKLLALSMLVIFPIIGFFLGIQYQKSKTPLQNQISQNTTQNQLETVPASPLSTPTVLNQKPQALNGQDIFAKPAKYVNQKVKITAMIDVHTGTETTLCATEVPCQKYIGTIYLKEANSGSASNEIQLAEKSRTDPSTYISLSCSSANTPILDCDGYKHGSLRVVEGTLVGQPTDSIDHYIYFLII